MRLANLDGRAVLTADGQSGLDVHTASGGRFGPSPDALYRDWDAFTDWAGSADPAGDQTLQPDRLRCPSPVPRQVFAVGLNYGKHATEAGLTAPDTFPPVFTKFVTSLTGPYTNVTLPAGGSTDWEVELVVVIGRTARTIPPTQAWEHVAGVAVGQDLSERNGQLAGPIPQFSLGKSHAGFGPIGPWLVTVDELPDRDDLELICNLNGEQVQRGRTSDLIFPVPDLIAGLSNRVTLLPGDLIFTGTPAGVGHARTPARYLKSGDRLVSKIVGLGEITQTFIAAPV